MILTFLIGAASASFAGPRSAAIPEITGQKLFVKAISISQLVFQTIGVIGPLLGAFIYAFLGSVTFWFSGLSYLISALILLITLIPSAKQDKDNKLTVKVVYSDLKDGFVYLFNEPVIRNLIILFMIIILGAAVVGPLAYPYIYEIIHNGDEAKEDLSQKEFGILGALSALGSIIGNLFFGKYESKIGRQLAIFLGPVGIGAYYLFYIFNPTIIQLWVLSLFLGIFNGMASLAVNAIFAEVVPNKIRARAYSATNAFLQAITVVFTALSGIIADNIGILETIVASGAFIVIFVCLFTVRTRFLYFAKDSTIYLSQQVIQ